MHCDPPDLLQESLGPFGPEVSRECPRKRGCPRECPKGLRSGVPRVSPECPGHLFDTPGTLSGTFWTPPFSGTPSGHSRYTSGPKGPRDSCSRSGGLQDMHGSAVWRLVQKSAPKIRTQNPHHKPHPKFALKLSTNTHRDQQRKGHRGVP